MSIPFVVESSTQAGYSPAPTPVQHYGGDFGAPTGGYQPVPQQPSGGFADPYSQQSAPSNYQNQNPYNPYLD